MWNEFRRVLANRIFSPCFMLFISLVTSLNSTNGLAQIGDEQCNTGAKPSALSITSISPSTIPLGAQSQKITVTFTETGGETALGDQNDASFIGIFDGQQFLGSNPSKANGSFSFDFTPDDSLLLTSGFKPVNVLITYCEDTTLPLQSNDQPPKGVTVITTAPSLFVPIVLSSAGMNNSFFTSELSLTNRGSTSATLDLNYTAAFGGGGGTASILIPAGRQQIIPDAISYLKSLGITIPDSGNRGGTLRVSSAAPTSLSNAAITVRTTTTVPEGRAGLAYAAVTSSAALTGPSYLCGLRQNQTDRSNIAIQNVGSSAEGNISLRLTVFSGDAAAPFSQILPDEVLPPGGFKQISGILSSNGLSLTNGYVRVERVNGTAPYYAYAVVNDQANSDGSFITPVLESSLAGRNGLVLPVIVETSSFNSEQVLTNWSATRKTVRFTYVADAIQNPDKTATFSQTIEAGEQLIIPNFVQNLRDSGLAATLTTGPGYAGALFAAVEGADVSGLFLGARTSAPGGGGRYGLFYSAVPYGTSATTEAWVYGLQQNGESRTNLALVNTGEVDGSPDTFRIELFDGGTAMKVQTIEGLNVGARSWIQLGTILAQRAQQGYAHVTRTSGSNPFITYAVVNDGASPGDRSGDGAFVLGVW
jgi:hypothetical protein